MTLILDPTVWNPRIACSAAIGPDRFVLALRELGFGDPFTAMLEYDGRFTQPWSRIECDGAVDCFSYGAVPGQDDPMAFAMTGDGEVFTLIPDNVRSDKIIGAGIDVDDADGRGQTVGIANIGTTTYVSGFGRQLYSKSAGGDWAVISKDAAAPPGYLPEIFSRLLALDDGSLIFSSHQPAGSQVQTNILDDPSYRPDMTNDEIVALMMRSIEEKEGGPPITRLNHFSAGVLATLPFLPDLYVYDMRQAPDGKVWIVGVDGLIMNGTPQDGFTRRDFQGDSQTLNSITWMNGQTIVAGNTTLHRFDGHMLHPIRPKVDPRVNDGIPNPQAIYGFGDVLLYVDFKHGVSTWNGSEWTQIVIPETLLGRTI